MPSKRKYKWQVNGASSGKKGGGGILLLSRAAVLYYAILIQNERRAEILNLQAGEWLRRILPSLCKEAGAP